MLTIRLQRTGRSGTAMFRLVVQDSRQSPTSGKVVMLLGSYDPHAKTLAFDKAKAAFYLERGAQPSPRVARLLKDEGVKLPGWVTVESSLQGKLRNPEKLRRNRPAEAAQPQAAAAAEEANEEVVEEPAADTSEVAETTEAEAPVEATPEADSEAETPADKA